MYILVLIFPLLHIYILVLICYTIITVREEAQTERPGQGRRRAQARQEGKARRGTDTKEAA